MRAIAKTLGKINYFLACLCCVLVAFDMVLICAEVILRVSVNYSIPGAVELAEYSLLYITFLGTAWLLSEEGHIKMDLLLVKLTPRIQSFTCIINSIVGAIVCLVLALYSAQTTWDQFLRGAYRATTLEIPVAILIIVIPIGSSLLFIEFLLRAYRYLINLKATK